MSAEEKANGDAMENEQKDEETKPSLAEEEVKEEGGKEEAGEEKKEDQKDGDDVGKEEDEDDEEEESSDEEELPLGSVEAPVQIMTGKRDRKKVERLVMKEPPKTPEKTFVLPVGRGVKIGEIPIISHFLEKTKSQDLKPLHKFLFARLVRDPRDLKKNLRQFTGFEFTKEDPEFAKREAVLCKFTLEGLKEICTILDVEKKGTKDVIMDRILDFCLNPQPSGRELPTKGKKKSQQKSAKKKKSKTKKPKGEGKKGGGDASTETEDGDTTMEDGTEADAEGDSSITEGEAKPKKKKATTPKPKTPKTPKTPKPKKAKAKPKSPKKKIAVKTPSKQSKKSSSVKSPKKTPQKRPHDDIVDDSSDDEPLTKKVKAPPTDKQIKETIKEILEGANLEEVTMKMVCRKVYDTYPQHPLQHKKDFIKSTVREIIS